MITTMQRVLVGLDGTPKDRPLVKWVAEFAEAVGAHVIAAHFVPTSTAWIVAGAQVDSGEYIEELREHLERDVLTPLLERDLLLHLYVRIGDPAHELAALARSSGADLIAIGSRDHTMLHDLLFRTTTRRLEHFSEIPVISVPCPVARLHAVH